MSDDELLRDLRVLLNDGTVISGASVEPLAINFIESSCFDDREVFPAGSVTFDNALLMRGINHEWHSRESLCDKI